MDAGELAEAERRLQELLDTTLDEVGEAEELERQRAKKAFLDENVTFSAKSIQAEQHIQKVLNLVKKTTFWEFRVDYLAELGAALHDARYVQVLSVDQAVISDAIAFMSVLATDWNENVRAAAVKQLANAAKCDDDVAVGTLVEALKDHVGIVRETAKNSLVRMTGKGDENLKWVDVGTTRPKLGSEIKNLALAGALRDKREFTHAEFESFNAPELSHDSYVAVQEGTGKIKYFKLNDVVSRASVMFENYLKAVRDCALEVILEVAVVERAVDVVGKLLRHERTDLRLWAVEALGDLAIKKRESVLLLAARPSPPATMKEQGKSEAGEAKLSPVSELIHEGKALVAELPRHYGEALLDDLKRSDTPVAHAVRVRTPELHVDPSGDTGEEVGRAQAQSRHGEPDSETQNSGERRVPTASSPASGSQQDVVYPYLECVLRKISYSIHDPNWQVQRTALGTMSTAVNLGYQDFVSQCCKYVVPIVYRNTAQQVVKFILDMNEGIKPLSNVDADGQYYTLSQAHSDKALVKEQLNKTQSDIASTMAIFNALAPTLGGPKQNKETFTVQKGMLDTSGTAQRTDTEDVTRDWIPDIPLRIMDVILVGPQRRLVQVSDLVPLQGGLEIYGSDRHGNRVYIPANSPLPDHQYVLAAGQRATSIDDGKGGWSTIIQPRTLPVISSSSARQLPRGHKYHTAAAFGASIQLAKSVPRSHQSFAAAPDRTRRNRLAEMSESMRTSASSPTPSALDSLSRQKRETALEAGSQTPQYGFAGNRSFTPEARFTGVMDFLTQSPAEMRSSYTKTRLGSSYRKDMATNRNHYTDPLDNNQIPPHQSLLPQPGHVPRVTSTPPGKSSPAWNNAGTSSRVATAGSPTNSRLNTGGSRLNTGGSMRLGTGGAGARAREGEDGRNVRHASKQLYAETFRLDDLEGELDEFVTYQVPQPAAPIGRPPSPKYTKELKRGGTMLTAERAKSFLEGIMDKQVHDLRSQTQGVGNFEKVIPGYHGPSPDDLFDKIYKDNHKSSGYSIYGRGPRRIFTRR